MTHTANYLDYLNASPSPFHAAHEAGRQLAEAGFVEVDEKQQWPSEPGSYFLIRSGALAAWIIPPKVSQTAGFAVFGSHTDSPCFKLKPTPDHLSPDGWGQLAVEVYGGMIWNSWLDRELALAGALYDRSGQAHLVRTGPLARIPQLAIHLDRTVNEGLKLNPQQHLRPVWTVDQPTASIGALLAEAAGLPEEEVASADVFLVPSQGAALFGDREQFVAAGRQDNLSSVFAGLTALKATAPNPEVIPVLVAFDHEEIGSATRTGAAGPFLEDVLRRTAGAVGATGDQFWQLMARSSCISADAGHSVHPNYAQLHDDDTRPLLGRGPLLKINANQRYASEGQGISLWHRVCTAAGVESQDFVSNNAVPCGSTIGPITATRLGLLTVDVGIPLLSMHSAREMSHVADEEALIQVATAYLNGNR
ncbi:M18 family aminopeptidase [Actinomyces sp. F1_1611]